MEITKQNEQYQINDTTEKYVVTGSLSVYTDGRYSVNISLTNQNSSTTASYYKSINDNHINTSYDVDATMEEDLLTYVQDNMQTILDKVSDN